MEWSLADGGAAPPPSGLDGLLGLGCSMVTWGWCSEAFEMSARYADAKGPRYTDPFWKGSPFHSFSTQSRCPDAAEDSPFMD